MNDTTPSQSAPLRILFHFRTRGTGAEGVHLSGMAGGFERVAGAQIVFSSPLGKDPRTTRGGNPFGQSRESLLAKLSRKCPRWCFELLEIGYNFSAWRRNRRMLAETPVSLIYERHAFFLFITAAMARRRKIPLVVEVNELAGDARIRAQPSFGGLVARADRFVFSRADLILVVSPHLARRAAERGADPAKVMILPNAVEPSVLNREDRSEELRRSLGIGENEIVVGFVGWFVDWHQLDRLVTVCADLHARGLPIRLLMVGDGPLGTSLRALAEATGFQDQITWTGPVAHDDVPSYISAIDIPVVPQSNAYRSPIKLFEYLAMGRAVVAPRLEPIESVTSGTDCVELFDPDSEQGLGQAIHALATNPERRKKAGEAGRKLVANRHTWDHNAARVLAALNLSQSSPVKS